MTGRHIMTYLDTGNVDAREFDAAGRRLVTAVFGDRLGLALFLGALAFFPLTWRIGILSSDNYIIANSVVALADGHLSVETIVFGPSDGVTPGTHLVDGRLYGRNYGLVVTAVPVYLLLQTVSLLADPRLLLAGVWSLVLLAVVVLVGRRLDVHREATLVGACLALGLFLANVVLATPLDPYWFPVIALQTVTALAGAGIALVVYRLVSAVHDRRLGLFAGVVVAVGTPVGFWATLPKRHSLTALFVLLAVYTLYRSRATSSDAWQLRFRALAYGWVGLLAWIHAAEALVLLVALVIVDIPTADRNGSRQLLYIGGAFLLSLVPFLLTNTLIAGSPLEPPRMLPGYGGGEAGLLDGGGGGPGGGAGGAGGAGGEIGGDGTGGAGGAGDGAGGAGGGTVPLVTSIATPLVVLIQQYAESMAALSSGHQLWSVFVRSGYIAQFSPDVFKAIHLSVLESMPLLGTAAVLPVIAWRRLRTGWQSLAKMPITDRFVLVVALLWVGLYLSRLPIHHQYTVRYLHPIYPLGVYLLVRLPAVREAIQTSPHTLVGSYAAVTVLGGVGYVAALASLEAVLSEAVQLYALVAVVLGVAVAVWAVVATTRSVDARIGAAVLGTAAGSMTVYILVSGFATFAYTNEFLLPLGRFVAETLRFVNPFGYLF